MEEHHGLHPHHPTVGMDATIIVGSDCYPATIIEVVSPKTVRVQYDNFKRVMAEGEHLWSESQDYEITPDPQGRVATFSLRKGNVWVERGKERSYGKRLAVGVKRAYYDYTK